MGLAFCSSRPAQRPSSAYVGAWRTGRTHVFLPPWHRCFFASCRRCMRICHPRCWDDIVAGSFGSAARGPNSDAVLVAILPPSSPRSVCCRRLRHWAPRACLVCSASFSGGSMARSLRRLVCARDRGICCRYHGGRLPRSECRWVATHISTPRQARVQHASSSLSSRTLTWPTTTRPASSANAVPQRRSRVPLRTWPEPLARPAPAVPASASSSKPVDGTAGGSS